MRAAVRESKAELTEFLIARDAPTSPARVVSVSSNGPDVAAIDFETEPIERGAGKPPRPVGITIWEPGREPEYLAFGHPNGNNCTLEQARERLDDIYRRHHVVFHNAQFDLYVGLEYFGIWPLFDYHDTLILQFLDDPYAKSLGLKELAESRLGVEPTEQCGLRQWILDNFPGAKQKPKDWAEFICKAPGAVVSEYAKGDVARTRKLFEVLHPSVAAQGMVDAYRRELALVPVLIDMGRRGVLLDGERLSRDLAFWEPELERVSSDVRHALGARESLNLDSPQELIQALERAGKVREWITTQNGNPSTSRKSFRSSLKDPALVALFERRSHLAACIRNFMRPWLALASKGDRLHAQWNGTRMPDGGGARTGRLSSRGK